MNSPVLRFHHFGESRKPESGENNYLLDASLRGMTADGINQLS